MRKKNARMWAVVMVMLAITTTTFAQSRREVMRERMSVTGQKVDSVLRKNYEKGTYDTLYIKRPESRLMLKLRGNLSGNYIHAKNTVDGNDIRAKLKTDMRATLSVGVNYMGLSAGMAINPARLSGRNKDMEFNLNAYANRFGIEAGYQLSKTLSGDITQNDLTYHLNKGYLRMAALSVTGYYAFNHRHFSYPAAFTQSYIQKRSAGSWLAGFSYQGGSIKTTGDTPTEMGKARIYVGNFAIGGGYGYNLVAKRWLFHLSAQPNVIIFNSNSVEMNGEKRSESYHFPEMIINSRGAVVYTINPKYFVGSTLVVNSTLFGNLDHYTRQVKGYARFFFGIRL
ncbi:MAG: DUF4421 family protein [Bacteroidaceae bacterium]|nr:DUF4421 family protein [Bacteroidaceae bacterium]